MSDQKAKRNTKRKSKKKQEEQEATIFIATNDSLGDSKTEKSPKKKKENAVTPTRKRAKKKTKTKSKRAKTLSESNLVVEIRPPKENTKEEGANSPVSPRKDHEKNLFQESESSSSSVIFSPPSRKITIDGPKRPENSIDKKQLVDKNQDKVDKNQQISDAKIDPEAEPEENQKKKMKRNQ